ncbi:hypothetical protein SARC_00747 [Sphaeroforma arctica JP610]|uniref:HhH-GPD domain-containing protein n=1 Tax=Sphaeroforma arctica JP610 TaxID=667725 RepID=A0A0L0GE07_9EUKA|nr:hypothetical protein SARC_00747 [Sphaeroforma arctica JP610]KNC87124.1 hypothetical protein SARC_00747 [Sphaeroforma arctica JP610]|eukprot:XP_014161026.1 hypothetical protein SARC_00747 [Sphaeroforma arctica JP610]
MVTQSWIPSTDKDNADGGVFERPLRYGYNYSETVYVRITLLRQRVDGVDQPALQVEEVLHGVKRDTPVVFSTLTQGHLAQIGMQVTRMFRLDEDISAFHAMQNEAKERGFGRLYRSPSTFEDMIKSITNSNMTWAGTVRMCALLCFHYGKRGAFPTPQEMPTSADELKTKCKVGYRGDRMLQVAALFLTPPEDLSAFDNTGEADMKTLPTPDPLSTPTKQKAAAKRARKTQEKLEKRRKNLVLVKRLVQADNPRLVVGDSQLVFALIKSLHGFGDFAASNVMQLMGYYDHLAADSETVRGWAEQWKGLSGDEWVVIGGWACQRWSIDE